MANRGAGSLYGRVALERRQDQDRGDGVVETASWLPAFDVRAGALYKRGGETVMAGRLEGRTTKVFYLRASAETRAIETDWRLKDLRDGGRLYNIREVTLSEDRRWVDLLCESGVVSG